MRSRQLPIVLAVLLVVIAGAATAYYGPSCQHRISRSEVLADAYLDPPPVWPPPRIQFRDVMSRCNFCNRGGPGDLAAAKQIELASLVSDQSLSGLQSSNLPDQPHSAADAPMPRTVWVVRWKSACRRPAPPGVTTCTAYSIIDDATGWELDVGQAWN